MWTVSIDFFWNIHANRIQLSNKETHAFLYLFRLTDRKRLTDQSIPKKPFIHPEDNLLQFDTIKENMLLEKQLFTVGTIRCYSTNSWIIPEYDQSASGCGRNLLKAYATRLSSLHVHGHFYSFHNALRHRAVLFKNIQTSGDSIFVFFIHVQPYLHFQSSYS